eukprot:586064-Prymnesium_polylepis.1
MSSRPKRRGSWQTQTTNGDLRACRSACGGADAWTPTTVGHSDTRGRRPSTGRTGPHDSSGMTRARSSDADRPTWGAQYRAASSQGSAP